MNTSNKMASSGVKTDTDFRDKVKEIVRHGFTTTGISIGVKLGIFELMENFDEPKTSQEIADAGGFKERYIREWLGGMVCSGIIEVTDAGDTDKFYLEKDRAPVLRDTYAFFSSYLLSVTKPYDDLLECFRKNGPKGIPFEKYSRIDDSRNFLTSVWCRDNLVPDVIEKFSGLKEMLDKGIEVLDAGCGVGITTRSLAHLFPASRITGFDLSHDAIKDAKSASVEDGLTNTSYIACDIANLPNDWISRFDFIFVRHVLHDLPFPDQALREFHRILKAEGVIIFIEMHCSTKISKNKSIENGPLYYVISLMYCMPSAFSVEGSFGLGCMSGNGTLRKLMEGAGFKVTDFRNGDGDERVYFVRKK